MTLREYYRGPQTGTYFDMFGFEWVIFGKSKIYFVTNVGQRREILLTLIREFDSIVVLEEKSIFKYIELGIEDDAVAAALSEKLKDFDCQLQGDAW